MLFRELLEWKIRANGTDADAAQGKRSEAEPVCGQACEDSGVTPVVCF